jgi:hypothetical protein
VAASDAEKPADMVLVLAVAAGTAGIGSFENACAELLNTTVGAMANTICANLRSLFTGNPKEMRDEEMVTGMPPQSLSTRTWPGAVTAFN